MNANLKEENEAKAKRFLLYFGFALFLIFLLAWAIVGSSREALGYVFLYLAVDFMSPQPDIDKIIIIPLFWMPLIMSMGMTDNKVTAYALGIAFSFALGILFLVMAIWLIGDGAWDKFKDIWITILKHSFTTFWGLLLTTLFIILIVLVLWAVSKSDQNERR